MTNRSCALRGLLFSFVLVSGLSALGSTFVGNGGNAGDVEWRVSLKQISMALDGIKEDPPADDVLCRCSETYSNNAVCDALNSLSVEQRRFCAVSLKKQLPVLQSLVHETQTVHVDWTRDDIDVLEDGHRRAVDAVTNPARGTVTLNAEKFRGLNASERVFLISHELFHLTTLDEKPMVDEGAVGPFKSREGSRQLINAMAAAIVIEADEARAFDRYKGTLRRPQGWKTNWIDFSVGAMKANAASVYGVTSYQTMRLRYSHYFGAVGFNAGFVQLKGDEQVLTQINSSETSRTFLAGLNVRLFPFKDPLTFLGQSNLVLSADVDFNKGEFNLKSAYNNQSAISNRVAGSGELRYYFPVAVGLWVSVAEAFESLPATYTIFGTQISNESNQFATSIGVSYAF